jgi:hypothetical protein
MSPAEPSRHACVKSGSLPFDCAEPFAPSRAGDGKVRGGQARVLYFDEPAANDWLA